MDSALSPVEIAARFGGFVMAHAALVASDLEEGELVCPFAVIEQAGKRKVMNFEADTQDQAVAQGRASLQQLEAGTTAWAFAHEGLMSTPGADTQQDVLLVSAWAPGIEEPLLLIQAFNPAPNGGFALVGELEIEVDGSAPAPHVQAVLQAEAMIGVGMHPRNVPWEAWRGYRA